MNDAAVDEDLDTPTPRRQAKSARNRLLVERRRRGETYARLGADYRITRERVRQIVQREEGLRGGGLED